MQAITSAATSRKHVPAIFKRVADGPGWDHGTMNVDLGGGKWDLMKGVLKILGVESHVIDPFNRTTLENQEAEDLVIWGGRANTCTISNVLNVIKEPGAREALLEEARYLTRPGGVLYVTVWHGDGSSRGHRTRDGWQANRPLKNYLREIRKVWSVAEAKNGLIIARRGIG